MKVIDLLNKIANREEVPEKIRIYNRNDSVYIWKPIENTSLYHYFNIATGERLGSDWRLDGKLLTEEIEIIEEEKEIEKISDKTRYYFGTKNNGMTKTDREALDSMFETIYETIDEILDELIKIKKEGK